MECRFVLFLFVSGSCAAPLPAQDKVDFARDIRPILSNRCFKCHGPAKQEAGLRLDDRDRATRRKIIVPGKSAESKLLARVQSTDPDERMPPPDVGDALRPDQIAALKQWIDQGAVYAPHWAFQKPQRPKIPEVASTSGISNPIDYFIRTSLAKEGLKPSPEADPATLIRRLSLDLTGLLPTPKEVDDFVRDYRSAKPQAKDRVFGELV